MRQRIGIARAFLHDPDVILLDEPTSNLDSLNESVILKALKEEADETTVVLVSHRKSTMGIADEVLQMNRREKLENKYRQNLMNMIDDIPPLSVMLTIIQAAMEPWEHGVDYNDVKKLYDIWIEEGNSQLELYQKVLIPIMVVSGFLPEKTAAALLEAVENA